MRSSQRSGFDIKASLNSNSKEWVIDHKAGFDKGPWLNTGLWVRPFGTWPWFSKIKRTRPIVQLIDWWLFDAKDIPYISNCTHWIANTTAPSRALGVWREKKMQPYELRITYMCTHWSRTITIVTKLWPFPAIDNLAATTSSPGSHWEIEK